MKRKVLAIAVTVMALLGIMGTPASAQPSTQDMGVARAVIPNCQPFTASSSSTMPYWRTFYGNGIYRDGMFRVSNGCSGRIRYTSRGTAFNSSACVGFQYSIQRSDRWVFSPTFHACGSFTTVMDSNTSSPNDINHHIVFWCWSEEPGASDLEWCLGTWLV